MVDSGIDTAPVADALASDGCDAFFPGLCFVSRSGRISVCGTAFDARDSSFLDGRSAAAQVTLFDYAEWLQSPEPQALAQLDVDRCGGFGVDDILPPVSGRLVIVIDDNQPTEDRWVPTFLVADAVASSVVRPSILAVSPATAAAWGATANTLAVFIAAPILAHIPFLVGSPRAGVEVAAGDGLAVTYFTDATPKSRVEPNAAAVATGANGSVLLAVPEGEEVQLSGSRTDPLCAWPTRPIISKAGYLGLWVSETECSE